VLKLAFINNSSQLISTASDGLVKIWNISNNECVNTFDEHEDKAWALCCSRDHKRFVTGGADGKLVVWRDVSSEELLKQTEDNEQTLLQ
jgi:U3 small nucleolar RNA-associated protein 13